MWCLQWPFCNCGEFTVAKVGNFICNFGLFYFTTHKYNEKTKPINVKLDPLEKLDVNTDNSKNYGAIALSKIYHELGLDRFFNGRQRFIKIKYNLNNAIKLLVFSRILFPNSKKSTYELKHKFFDNTDFTLPNIYDALTRLYNYKTELITWLYEKVGDSYQRDNSIVFYDVTNYYFEIDSNDDVDDKIELTVSDK